MRERICRMICSTSTFSDRTEKSDMSFTRHLPLGISTFAICHRAFGICRLAFAVWHLAFGIWHLSFGIDTAIPAARHPRAPGQELRRLRDARAQDAQRTD